MKKTIYLAGGCFWGCQKYFDLMEGVLETEVGYANGPTASGAPTFFASASRQARATGSSASST